MLNLVTGATGCLGSNLVRALLSQGHEVAILRRPDDSLELLAGVSESLDHRMGDVLDLDSLRRAMAGVQRVYHLAGVVAAVSTSSNRMMEVNVQGAENVARAALESGVERLVHTSSTAAIGWPARGQVANEEFEFNGRGENTYQMSKHLGERAVLGLVKEGLDAVVLNPSLVIAPRSKGLARAFALSKAGRLWAFPSGGIGVAAARDFIDAEIKAMERGRTGERYIVNTVNLSYRELLTKVAQVVGGQRPRIRIPNWVMLLVARVDALYISRVLHDLDKAATTEQEAAALARTSYYDQSKAVRELGIAQSSIDDALRELCDWAEEYDYGYLPPVIETSLRDAAPARIDSLALAASEPSGR